MEQGDGEGRRCGVDSIELSMTDGSDEVAAKSGEVVVTVLMPTTNRDPLQFCLSRFLF